MYTSAHFLNPFLEFTLKMKRRTCNGKPCNLAEVKGETLASGTGACAGVIEARAETPSLHTVTGKPERTNAFAPPGTFLTKFPPERLLRCKFRSSLKVGGTKPVELIF